MFLLFCLRYSSAICTCQEHKSDVFPDFFCTLLLIFWQISRWFYPITHFLTSFSNFTVCRNFFLLCAVIVFGLFFKPYCIWKLFTPHTGIIFNLLSNLTVYRNFSLQIQYSFLACCQTLLYTGTFLFKYSKFCPNGFINTFCHITSKIGMKSSSGFHTDSTYHADLDSPKQPL